MTIGIANDHAGFGLKKTVLGFLKNLGYTVEDFGTHSDASVDYPDFIYPCAQAVADGSIKKAIVICGSGIGASIVANKVKGIRCALCSNIMTAKYSRLHNDANILALGARVVSEDDALEMIRIWLNTEFEGGRHKLRLDKIKDI